MARLHGKDRGLKPVQMADGKIYWQARLYHHGQEWRSKAIPSKQEARAIYTAKKAEFREAEYFPAIHQAKQSQLVTVADLMALVLADYRRQHRKTLSDAEEKARFIIEETSRFEIEAPTMEAAKAKWLDSPELWEIMKQSFVDVTERHIESLTPGADGKLEESEEF